MESFAESLNRLRDIHETEILGEHEHRGGSVHCSHSVGTRLLCWRLLDQAPSLWATIAHWAPGLQGGIPALNSKSPQPLSLRLTLRSLQTSLSQCCPKGFPLL